PSCLPLQCRDQSDQEGCSRNSPKQCGERPSACLATAVGGGRRRNERPPSARDVGSPLVTRPLFGGACRGVTQTRGVSIKEIIAIGFAQVQIHVDTGWSQDLEPFLNDCIDSDDCGNEAFELSALPTRPLL